MNEQSDSLINRTSLGWCEIVIEVQHFQTRMCFVLMLSGLPLEIGSDSRGLISLQ